MKLQISKVTKIRVSEINSLDPISIILEDFSIGQGQIIIECYGKSWTAYWGAMGKENISQFFSSSDNDYLISKLSPCLDSRITDYDNLKKWLFSNIIKNRKENNLNKSEARELWLDVFCYGQDSKQWLESDRGMSLAQKCTGYTEWWYYLPETDNHEYMYLSRIVDVVKEGLILYLKEMK